jgi:hypothetical protein
MVYFVSAQIPLQASVRSRKNTISDPRPRRKIAKTDSEPLSDLAGWFLVVKTVSKALSIRLG